MKPRGPLPARTGLAVSAGEAAWRTGMAACGPEMLEVAAQFSAVTIDGKVVISAFVGESAEASLSDIRVIGKYKPA